MTGPGVPVVDDLYPAFGPYHKGEPKTKQIDLTFANLFLTLSGTSATSAVIDNGDMKEDIASLAGSGNGAGSLGLVSGGFQGRRQRHVPRVRDSPQCRAILWLRPTESRHCGATCTISRSCYPQSSPARFPIAESSSSKADTKTRSGGRRQTPMPQVRQTFRGDDDHPGYSDSHISEAMAATYVNAIARSKYWKDSVDHHLVGRFRRILRPRAPAGVRNLSGCSPVR